MPAKLSPSPKQLETFDMLLRDAEHESSSVSMLRATIEEVTCEMCVEMRDDGVLFVAFFGIDGTICGGFLG